MFLPVIFSTVCGIVSAPVAGVGLLAAGAAACASKCFGGSSSGGSSSGSYSESSSYCGYSSVRHIDIPAVAPRRHPDCVLRSHVRYVDGGIIIG